MALFTSESLYSDSDAIGTGMSISCDGMVRFELILIGRASVKARGSLYLGFGREDKWICA